MKFLATNAGLSEDAGYEPTLESLSFSDSMTDTAILDFIRNESIFEFKDADIISITDYEMLTTTFYNAKVSGVIFDQMVTG